MQVSHMAENLIGSEIIKLAGEINQKIKAGENIYNFTIGDFDPQVFPIPEALTLAITQAYNEGHTNYPAANGIVELREAVAHFLKRHQKLEYSADDILIAGGARPLIYAIYQTILDPGDTVLFPVPSWNNNHYCHLTHARELSIETRPEEHFMPTPEELEPHLATATLVALCSPLNPTGTTFTRESLHEICELISQENQRRASENRKPLYLMYDQIYWTLTFGNTVHYDPVSLHPELRDYTIYVDGLSKAFAATGVRVGWSFGPRNIIDKMKSILGHVGAWAPKAEQVATARFLNQTDKVDSYLAEIREKLFFRLHGFYLGFEALSAKGYPVKAIHPQAAIYLTIQLALHGKVTPEGKTLTTTKEITAYVLEQAKLAVVPFYAFGASENSSWYRLSVGTCKEHEVAESLAALELALARLS